jgi:hypothetical protein
MVDLYADLGARTTIFLRFNPDGYELDGVRYPTPFPVQDSGEMTVDAEEMEERMYELIQTILFYKDHVPDEPILYHYLFYGDQPLEGDSEEDEDEDNSTTGI